MRRMQILDHGYLELHTSWGSDETIIEAARMSTQKGFEGWGQLETCGQCNGVGSEPGFGPGHLCRRCWGKKEAINVPGDEKLLGFLWKHNHATPFEMAGAIFEVQAPIFVFREWHRHRTQCLAGDTKIYFELPERLRKGKKTAKKITIEELWRKWQPTVRTDRPERQINALWPRSRIQLMSIRCLNEETGEFATTRIVDIIQSNPKTVYRITTVSGKTVKASAEHRFFTDRGWLCLKDFVDLPHQYDAAWSASAMLTVGTTVRNKAKSWEPPPFDLNEETWLPVVGWENLYQVSNMGRVKRVTPGRGVQIGIFKKGIVGAQGYLVVSLSKGSKTYLRTVHSLILEAFVGPRSAGSEARHFDHNRLNNRLSNLSWGSSKENSGDMLEADRHQRLVSAYEQIVSIEWGGQEVTYDLEVEGPWHNFVAEGIVVHNSYNEMSARYAPLPDVNYVPSVERLMINSGGSNKQAGTVAGAMAMDDVAAEWYRRELAKVYTHAERLYQQALSNGVPKELARIHLPVGRYSRMRASANLRNWLAFLKLRQGPDAQWEIRQYANALHDVLAEVFPRTLALFDEKKEPA